MGLRARLTLAATGVVALGLLAGSVLLSVALHAALLNALDGAGRSRARDVAALVAQDRLPRTLPSGASLVQVVDAQQRVRAASPGADRLVPLLDGAQLAAARRGGAVSASGAAVGQGGTFRVVAAVAGPASDPLTVLVASPLDQVEASTQVVRRGLLVGVPALLAVVAGLAWALVGSVLRPVDELRRGAEEITGTGEGRRLPVPAAEDELARLARTLNDMLDRLDVSTARQRAFVADAAHELRSPVASARTQLEVGLAHPALADWPATAADVLTDLQRLGRLVGDLLLLAKADSGRADRPLTPVDLTAVAAQAVQRLAPHERARVRLLARDRQLVCADADALARVVTNLVDNALRHARSQVEVDVQTLATGVQLRVDDDGPGIEVADRARVFERFTRLDAGRGRTDGGSGLGLAIVAELTAAHGGTVELSQSPAGGLRAAVLLPAMSDWCGDPAG